MSYCINSRFTKLFCFLEQSVLVRADGGNDGDNSILFSGRVSVLVRFNGGDDDDCTICLF